MEEINKGFSKLSEDELDNVSGGFISEDGASWGYDVICPNCGNSNRDSIIIGRKYMYGEYDTFRCRACRTPFGVDVDGWAFSLRQGY